MINVVGIGLDGAIGLSENILKIINHASVLIGSDRHLSYFPNHSGIKLEVKDFLEISLKINHYLQQEQKIVILASGDPLFFGLGRFLLTKFPPEQLSFYPHVNCVQLAFNKLKIPWQDTRIVSIHGRDFEELITLLKQGKDKIAILTDSRHNPATIVNLYHQLYLPKQYDFWVCENLGDETENISYFPLGKALKLYTFSSLNIVILISKNQDKMAILNINKLPLFGIPDHYFFSFSDRPGLMTKKEVRLMILAELQIQENQVIWDLGAGTGSVSIEIGRLSPSSKVYAVEKTAIGITLIEKNCQLFQVKNVVPIHGTAPRILPSLPMADRIFIGGSGGNLTEILEFSQSKLPKNGIIVLALATLENQQESIQWFKTHNWQYHLLQVQISRSIPVADLTRLTPLNPVTIITAKK
jgi:precorrin-6Y C5,15-methyltransferase (decarboxylating)